MTATATPRTAPARPTATPTRSGAGSRKATLPPAPSPGHSTAPSSAPKRARQAPWIALGLLLVVGSTLGFAWWSITQGERVPAIVAKTDIAAGDIIDNSDLAVVSIATDAQVSVLSSQQGALVVGQIARGPIPAGTLLSEALVAEASIVAEGEAVVGLLLDAGAYPATTLRAGDRVEVIAVEANPAATAVGEQLGEVLTEARVWAVEFVEDGRASQRFVSIVVDRAFTEHLSQRAGENEIRLTLIAAGS